MEGVQRGHNIIRRHHTTTRRTSILGRMPMTNMVLIVIMAVDQGTAGEAVHISDISMIMMICQRRVWVIKTYRVWGMLSWRGIRLRRRLS